MPPVHPDTDHIDAERAVKLRKSRDDDFRMELQASSPALMIQANALDAVRSTLASAQQATTPQQHADVILQLSTAATQLLTSSR
jgi:hypothetical protein